MRPSPLRFDPSYEQAAGDSGAVGRGGLYGRQLGRCHGLLRGELQVFGDLPGQLAQGVFAIAQTFPLVMRLSAVTAGCDLALAPRQMAIKLFELDGLDLPGIGDQSDTQDFVFVDSARPQAPSARLQPVPPAWTCSEPAPRHPLCGSYYVPFPCRYGDHMARLAVAPVSPELTTLDQAPWQRDDDDRDGSDGLRDAVESFFSVQAGLWELRVQLCTDLQAMPLDPEAAWPETLSPYVSVARVVIPAQPMLADEQAEAIEQALCFDPWLGSPVHRPLAVNDRYGARSIGIDYGSRAKHHILPGAQIGRGADARLA